MLRSALRATAAVVAIAGIAELIRRLTRDGEHASLPSARATMSPKPTAAPRSTAPCSTAAYSAPAAATRKELYEEAQRLEIKGRSSMSKDELAEALTQAKSPGGT